MAISQRNLPERESWSTRIGVIMAVAGSAVGLGNFLRFPGVAAQNGGGAFMVPYFIAFLLIGIPICWSEWIMGRMGGRKSGLSSAPGILGYLCGGGRLRYAGALAVFIPVVIYMYYVYVEAWCLAYAWFSLTGKLYQPGTDYAAFFGQFTGLDAQGTNYFPSVALAFIFFLITFFTNFFFVYRGLSRGIEKFSIIALPILLVCAVFVLFRVLTLGAPDPSLPDRDVIHGLGFMWEPEWSKLTDASVWLAACGQIFFSLSIGFGIILTYASYLNRDDDVVLSGLTASATNEFCEVCLGGLIIIPAAFIFLGPQGTAEASGSVFGLGFVTMPHIFVQMPLGQLFGFLFYVLLFLAGVTSSLSMLQPAIAFFEEGFDMPRRVSVTFLAVITLFGACSVIFSHGDTVLGTMDHYASDLGIPLMATIQIFIFIFVLKVRNGVEEGMRGADIALPRWFPFVIAYITPVFLVTVLGSYLWQTISPLWREAPEGAAAAEHAFWSTGSVTLLGLGAFFLLNFILVKLAWPRMQQRIILYAEQNKEAGA